MPITDFVLYYNFDNKTTVMGGITALRGYGWHASPNEWDISSDIELVWKPDMLRKSVAGHPLDGIDLIANIEGTTTERESSVLFWSFDTKNEGNRPPYISLKLKTGKIRSSK